MISVDSLLYKIDQRLNKLSTNEHQQIALEDKILALNEAQIKLIKQKLDGVSTISGLGLDAFKKRYEDLQKFAMNYEVGKLPLTLVNPKINQWNAYPEQLNPKFMFYLDSYITANKGRCENRIIWINQELAKHGDIPMLLKQRLKLSALLTMFKVSLTTKDILALRVILLIQVLGMQLLHFLKMALKLAIGILVFRALLKH